MAYSGFVTRLKNVEKDPNSDRLYTATALGDNIIVGGDSKGGDIVLYLPQDGAVSYEFGIKLNLFRKGKDGNKLNGYLDANGHIKALKLRGLRSEGIAIPVDKVAKYYSDIDYIEVGMPVTKLNNEVIVQKYVPRVKENRTKVASPVTNRKAELAAKYPYFTQHIDTPQLRYQIEQLKAGDILTLTEKCHGCFKKGTKVRMANGKLKAIEMIKVGDEVLSYNKKTKKFEARKVVHCFVNPASKNWRELKFSRDYIRGDKRGAIICTENHPFWVEEQQKYVQAKELKIGETVSTAFPTIVITDFQKEVILGQILGDGCLMSFQERTAEIQGGSKIDHLEYQEFLSEMTQGLYYLQDRTHTSGYGTEMVRGRTSRSADMYNYLKDKVTFSNRSGTRKLKPNFVNDFSPLSAAIFFMEDGSLSHSEKQSDRATIAVCDYVEEDVDIILDCFKKFNINPVKYCDSEGYWRLRFNKRDAELLFKLIGKYIPKIMRYKLGDEYEVPDYEQPIDPLKHFGGYVLSPQIVERNDEHVGEFDFEYDLEIEGLHNYVVGLSVVHNTSQRFAKTLTVTPRKLFGIIPLKPKKEYTYISGTRRVIKEKGHDGNGFYGGDESFRLWADLNFQNKLLDGEQVYFEVVGYTENGTPIMPSGDVKLKEYYGLYGKKVKFSYGCKQDIGESTLFVYRMNRTLEDGTIIEYPTWKVQKRCEEMNVNFVPILKQLVFTNAEDLIAEITAIAGEGNPSTIDPSHVMEGVVVRKENSDTFSAFKDKTFLFKVVEGIIKESALAPDREEAEGELGDE